MGEQFRLKYIDEIRKHFIEEIEPKELMSTKHKKVCTTLNFVENFLVLPFAITGCISVFSFAPLLGSKKNYEFGNKTKNLCNSCVSQ